MASDDPSCDGQAFLCCFSRLYCCSSSVIQVNLLFVMSDAAVN